MQFVPIYKDYLWGGNRIEKIYKRSSCPGICAESWEISDRHDGMSVVADGMLSGATLHQIVETMPDEVFGGGIHPKAFPLIVKLIDAKQRLSVQVHPDDKTAETLAAEAKTEMWYILSAKPGAKLFAGLKENTTEKIFTRALKENTVEQLLNTIPVRAGDSIYIPGGTVHAIGEGCLILEVQQNSNTTYRVYDWNRTDKNGKARELHINEAIQTINWSAGNLQVTRHHNIINRDKNQIRKLVASPYFTASRLDLKTSEVIKNPCHGFSIIFTATGSLVMEANGVKQFLPAGTTCLLPAAISEYSLTPVGSQAAVIHIRQPLVTA